MEGLPHTNPQEWPKAPHLRAELMRNLRRTLFDAYTDWWMMPTPRHGCVTTRLRVIPTWAGNSPAPHPRKTVTPEELIVKRQGPWFPTANLFIGSCQGL